MRTATATLVLAMAIGQAPPAIGQSRPPDVGAGRIAWFDLTTSNLARSSEFYAQLFGWQFNSLPGTDQAVEIVQTGLAIGTLRGTEGAISPYNGVVYIQVPDMAASVQRARALGGTIPPGFPFNLSGGVGAVALVVEPGGHPIGLYSRAPLPE